MRLPLLPLLICLAACNSSPTTPGTESTPPAATAPVTTAPAPAPPPPTSPRNTYDIDAQGVPQFVTAAYLDPRAIERISRFRSGWGHDYSDSVESCRSMKHYMQPPFGGDWSRLDVRSPVTGRVAELMTEWAGVQLRIEPAGYPAFRVVLFHVTLLPQIVEGTTLVAGETIGTHVGSQTTSDIALSVDTPAGYRLVSIFDAMDDATFATYQARGVGARSDLVISRGARDAQPLSCSGETFASAGTIENWVTLH